MDTDTSPPDAFVASKSYYELFGEELRPFSPSRKVAAQSMGMLYPYIGDGGERQFNTTGMYPGIVKDAVILLWLCNLKDPVDLSDEEKKAGAWTPSRALRAPESAMEEAMVWADQEEMIDVLGPKWQEAVQVFVAIVSGVAASEFQLRVVTPEGSPVANEQEEESPKV